MNASLLENAVHAAPDRPDGESIIRKALLTLSDDYKVFYHPQKSARDYIDPYDRALEIVILHRVKGILGISTKFGDIAEEPHGLINQYQPRRYFYKILDPAKQAQSALKEMMTSLDPAFENMPVGIAVFLPETKSKEFFDPKVIFFFEEDFTSSYFASKLDDMFPGFLEKEDRVAYDKNFVILANFFKQHSQADHPFAKAAPETLPAPAPAAKPVQIQALEVEGRDVSLEPASPNTPQAKASESLPEPPQPQKPFGIVRSQPAHAKKPEPAAYDAVQPDEQPSPTQATPQAAPEAKPSASVPPPMQELADSQVEEFVELATPEETQHEFQESHELTEQELNENAPAGEAVAFQPTPQQGQDEEPATQPPSQNMQKGKTAIPSLRMPQHYTKKHQRHEDLQKRAATQLPHIQDDNEAPEAASAAKPVKAPAAGRMPRIKVEQHARHNPLKKEVAQQRPVRQTPKTTPIPVVRQAAEAPDLLTIFQRLEDHLHVPRTERVILSPEQWIISVICAAGLISGSFFVFRNLSVLLAA